jgi:hypothetical protein
MIDYSTAARLLRHARAAVTPDPDTIKEYLGTEHVDVMSNKYANVSVSTRGNSTVIAFYAPLNPLSLAMPLILKKDGTSMHAYEVVRQLSERIGVFVNKQITEDSDLWVTGHRRGGLLASIFSHYYSLEDSKPISGTYTFGAIKSGLSSPNAYHLVNSGDLIPSYPFITNALDRVVLSHRGSTLDDYKESIARKL